MMPSLLSFFKASLPALPSPFLLHPLEILKTMLIYWVFLTTLALQILFFYEIQEDERMLKGSDKIIEKQIL
jgi:hypothetical protein